MQKDLDGGGELNLEYIFEKLFAEESGQGYPRERAVSEQRNKRILDEVKKVTYKDLPTVLKELDRDLVRGALRGGEDLKNFSLRIANVKRWQNV